MYGASVGVQFVQSQKTLREFVQPFRFSNDDFQVFFLHFRRDRSVDNGFQIPFDGGEGRTKIVGDVGNKFVLIFPQFVQLIRHIIQGSGKIAHFIIGMYRDVVAQITAGIFACPDGNLL